jgi:hypothetical protein
VEPKATLVGQAVELLVVAMLLLMPATQVIQEQQHWMSAA